VSSRPLRIGTRGSPMALYQATLVRDRLRAVHPELAAGSAVGRALELVPIRTTGDRVQTRLLAEIGGKGLFTKEIEEALLDARIDLAVHSLKDMETLLPAGLAIGCVLERDDPRDVLVGRTPLTLAGLPLASLPLGARVGTASLRRRAQLLRMRPDLAIVPIRGNVNTRLAKLDAGEVEALVLALCGLRRIGKDDAIGEILEVDAMLPAVAQGALAVECRAFDEEVHALLAPLHHEPTAACVLAERSMLKALDGSCRTPIAGLARIDGDSLTLDALLLSPDGSAERRGSLSGPVADAALIGTALGEQLRCDAGPEFGFN
jgi:hydroxymethylbilane synthase